MKEWWLKQLREGFSICFDVFGRISVPLEDLKLLHYLNGVYKFLSFFFFFFCFLEASQVLKWIFGFSKKKKNQKSTLGLINLSQRVQLWFSCEAYFTWVRETESYNQWHFFPWVRLGLELAFIVYDFHTYLNRSHGY